MRVQEDIPWQLLRWGGLSTTLVGMGVNAERYVKSQDRSRKMHLGMVGWWTEEVGRGS